jgi:hypothetical protein
VYGKIYYNPFRIIIGYIFRVIRLNPYNPLEAVDMGSFHGKLYLLSRNDLDISKYNWKEMLVKEYSIIHYKDAQRIKLYNPISYHYQSLQIPDKIVLINFDKIPDPILNQNIDF